MLMLVIQPDEAQEKPTHLLVEMKTLCGIEFGDWPKGHGFIAVHEPVQFSIEKITCPKCVQKLVEQVNRNERALEAEPSCERFIARWPYIVAAYVVVLLFLFWFARR